MNHKPEPGTRVRYLDVKYPSLTFTGIVQKGDDTLLADDTVSVLRDDTVEGAGVKDPSTGKWGYLVNWKNERFELYSCEDSLNEAQSSQNQHIMGLSPEEIDRDKYEAFMRDLQS